MPVRKVGHSYVLTHCLFFRTFRKDTFGRDEMHFNIAAAKSVLAWWAEGLLAQLKVSWFRQFINGISNFPEYITGGDHIRYPQVFRDWIAAAPLSVEWMLLLVGLILAAPMFLFMGAFKIALWLCFLPFVAVIALICLLILKPLEAPKIGGA